MKNNKILIIALITIIVVVIFIALLRPVYDTYVFRNINKKELIETLEKIEDDTEKNKEVENALERKWITNKEAENILKK